MKTGLLLRIKAMQIGLVCFVRFDLKISYDRTIIHVEFQVAKLVFEKAEISLQ